MELLTDAALWDALTALNEGLDSPWEIHDNCLKKEFVFSDFVAAFGFMSQAAIIAEKMNHHPDWSNSYKRVEVSLSTHEASGITQRDFDLAGAMNRFTPK